MLIKCQPNTQKFQENALLTKASACHKLMEEFCVAGRVLLFLTVFGDDIKTFSFLFPIVGNTLVYYVFLSFVAFFLAIGGHTLFPLAVYHYWLWVGVEYT